jgi:hypothetical protein
MITRAKANISTGKIKQRNRSKSRIIVLPTIVLPTIVLPTRVLLVIVQQAMARQITAQLLLFPQVTST